MRAAAQAVLHILPCMYHACTMPMPMHVHVHVHACTMHIPCRCELLVKRYDVEKDATGIAAARPELDAAPGEQ